MIYQKVAGGFYFFNKKLKSIFQRFVKGKAAKKECAIRIYLKDILGRVYQGLLMG
jgi:hypothetical protein